MLHNILHCHLSHIVTIRWFLFVKYNLCIVFKYFEINKCMDLARHVLRMSGHTELHVIIIAFCAGMDWDNWLGVGKGFSISFKVQVYVKHVGIYQDNTLKYSSIVISS